MVSINCFAWLVGGGLCGKDCAVMTETQAAEVISLLTGIQLCLRVLIVPVWLGVGVGLGLAYWKGRLG
jgi:hypothetical protein